MGGVRQLKTTALLLCAGSTVGCIVGAGVESNALMFVCTALFWFGIACMVVARLRQ